MHIFGTISTDSNGNFTINGTVEEPVGTGYASIVIETTRSGYVGNDGIDLGVFVNVTDDSNLTHNLLVHPPTYLGSRCYYCTIRAVTV